MKTAIVETPFETELKQQIRNYIRDCISQGTTGMTVENLKQCVRAPSTSLQGAPQGTNARYYYTELFRKVCQAKDIAAFIID